MFVYFLYSWLVCLVLSYVSCVSFVPVPVPRSPCVLCVPSLLSVTFPFLLFRVFSSLVFAFLSFQKQKTEIKTSKHLVAKNYFKNGYVKQY